MSAQCKNHVTSSHIRGKEKVQIDAHSRMQRLLPRLYHRPFVFCVVGSVSFLVNPCFVCIGCWIDTRPLVQVGPLRCVGMLLPIVRLDGLGLLG